MQADWVWAAGPALRNQEREGEMMLIPQLRSFGACSGFLIDTCPFRTRRQLVFCYGRLRGYLSCVFFVFSACVFVKALPNISDGISVRHNICISNAQYYDLSARRNLWCEILEFWACSDNILTLCRLRCQEEKCAINTELNKPHRVAIAPLLHSNSATFIIQ